MRILGRRLGRARIVFYPDELGPTHLSWKAWHALYESDPQDEAVRCAYVCATINAIGAEVNLLVFR